MATGKSRDEWGRVASLMALIANCNRDSRRPPFEPRQFMPRSLMPVKRLSPTKSVEFLADFLGIKRPEPPSEFAEENAER